MLMVDFCIKRALSHGAIFLGFSRPAAYKAVTLVVGCHFFNRSGQASRPISFWTVDLVVASSAVPFGCSRRSSPPCAWRSLVWIAPRPTQPRRRVVAVAVELMVGAQVVQRGRFASTCTSFGS